MNINAQIGAKLRAARQRAGISQTELAKRSGVDQASISRAERGMHRLSADQVAAVAVALGISPAELMRGVAEPAGNPAAAVILSDDNAAPGLRDLARDKSLMDALEVTREEMEALAACPVEGITKDGYVQLLITLRAIRP